MGDNEAAGSRVWQSWLHAGQLVGGVSMVSDASAWCHIGGWSFVPLNRQRLGILVILGLCA